jgi:hypothetical protein
MNNYLQFSQVIPHLTDDEVKWLMNYVENRHRGLDVEGNELEEDEVGMYPDFGFKIMKDDDWGTYAWFFAEESGNVAQVGETVQEFLKVNRPEGSFSMTWADFADTLRPGQFDGGGLFVTAKDIKMFHAVEWVRGQEKEFAA